ncbi:hypothetical protein [Clostridium paraputrificum]|uniref:hypothetical protein n=1 Tax=Clostridium paraputrificum TaxID=29363 RepID=UPI0015D49CCB|nr:hypothetical protein [Clostridium paraputrificum]
MKITEVRRYKVQGKKVKRENNDNKDRDELCLWQSSFFAGINIHEACIIRI